MILSVVFVTAVAAFLLIFYTGKDRVEPGRIQTEQDSGVRGKTVTATVIPVTDWYEAVGTIRPKTETQIEAQISAQVIRVTVSAGDIVKKDQILVELDSRQMDARLSQVREALKSSVLREQQAKQLYNAAVAAFKEVEANYQRIKNYVESQAATRQDLERSESRFYEAKAGLKRAEKAIEEASAGIRQAQDKVREVQVSQAYTNIRAPLNGKILKRLIEPGDLALPGKPVMLMKTSEELQIEAFVGEGMIKKITTGISLSCVIDAVDTTVTAKVTEIIPYADPQTRTFLVKAVLPFIDGIYPGMYAKLLIPWDTIDIVAIPPEAVRRIGQLEMVAVKVDNTWQMRFVKTGKRHDGLLEILSGLSGDEILMVGKQGNDRKQ